MSKAVVLILILGSFLGGYYLGQREGSPDLFAWLPGASSQAANAAENFSNDPDRQVRTTPGQSNVKPVVIEVGGKKYIIGQKYSSGLLSDHQDQQQD